MNMNTRCKIAVWLVLTILLSACLPAQPTSLSPGNTATAGQTQASSTEGSSGVGGSPTPLPTRTTYSAGEEVDYIAQPGDTLVALAAHFNTSIPEIRQANPIIPASVTTLPPGLPMKIPIYFAPFWGTPYHILPDSLFINGPAQVDFSTENFLAAQPGWLKNAHDFVSGYGRSGAQIIDIVAINFSISPRLLLALLEYQSEGITRPDLPEGREAYPLGYPDRNHEGLYLQLVWAANALNNGYYGWRSGRLTALELLNGRIDRPDPWQNAASVGIQHFFSQVLESEAYTQAVSPFGFARSYAALFGNPWQNPEPHLPGNLTQPDMRLPFEPERSWAFTGGPHTAWGEGDPWAALDFAPPAVVGGCTPSSEWVTAAFAGKVVRSEPAIVVLDQDQDGDEKTGWVLFYLHLATEGRVSEGVTLQVGDKVGHPSCEGGRATGTHVHLARKYNGEWIPADGPLAFNLEGWIAHNGEQPYGGTLTRFSKIISACLCSDQKSQVQSAKTP